MNEAGNNVDISAETVPLREKLRAIRDSDHPASPWARNVVQCLDDLKERPDDPDLLRALGRNAAMLERCMGGISMIEPLKLTAGEIAMIFGLRPHRNDPQ